MLEPSRHIRPLSVITCIVAVVFAPMVARSPHASTATLSSKKFASRTPWTHAASRGMRHAARSSASYAIFILVPFNC